MYIYKKHIVFNLDDDEDIKQTIEHNKEHQNKFNLHGKIDNSHIHVTSLRKLYLEGYSIKDIMFSGTFIFTYDEDKEEE